MKLINSEKGISLLISFLIITVVLSVTLGLSTIMLNKIKILGAMGNAVSAFYAAESGTEKTLYFDRKEGQGNNRGLCRLCSRCADCAGCQLTPLALNGCNQNSCNNCQVTYTSTFNNRSYAVAAKVAPGSFFSSEVRGIYKETTKTLKMTSSSMSSIPIDQQ